jgi:hypothetical protein
MTALLSSKNPPFFLKTLQDLPDLHRLIIAFLIKPSMKARRRPLERARECSTNHRSPMRITIRYGWIWSVQRNCQVAIALIAIETTKSEISLTLIFAGPLPVSTRNIQGRRIMA